MTEDECDRSGKIAAEIIRGIENVVDRYMGQWLLRYHDKDDADVPLLHGVLAGVHISADRLSAYVRGCKRKHPTKDFVDHVDLALIVGAFEAKDAAECIE